MIMNQKGRGNDCFQTPRYIFDQLNSIFNFDIDIACTSKNCLCDRGFYHDQGLNALSESWAVQGGGERSVIPLLAKKRNLSRKPIKKLARVIAQYV